MGRGVGDDRNSLNIGILAQRLGIAVHCGHAQLLRDLLGAVEVCVRNRDQLRARNAVCDIAGVLIAQTADTDDADFQLFHRYALL